MKKNEVFFKDTNFVGYEVESVQEVVKGLAANMQFANQDGVGFCYDEEEEDEDGNTTYREPTEQEVFDRIQDFMLNFDGVVYMGMFLDNSKYMVTPYKITTLQSDFCVRQRVYIVHDNKIVYAQVQKVQMVSYYDGSTSGTETKYEVAWSEYGRTYSAIVKDGEMFASVAELTECLSNNIVGSK